MEYLKKGKEIKVRVTKDLLDLFYEYSIYFKPDGSQRLKEGQTLNFAVDTIIEQNSAFYNGDTLCTIGTCSYFASVPSNMGWNVSCGRFSSVGAFSIAVPRHPIEGLTTSVISYNRGHAFVRDIIEQKKKKDVDYMQKISKTVPLINKGGIDIGSDVWIGKDVLFNPGVRVGHGAIVAANSVVTKNIPAYEIWGGNPARFIRKRFAEEIIDKLLALEWWNYSPSELLKYDMSSPERFIEFFDVNEVALNNPKKIKLFDVVSCI